MDFNFSSENSMIKNAIRDWVEKECPVETVRAMDDNSEYPDELFSKLGELGFNGLTIEEEYGGEGINLLGCCLIIMEIASRYPALARCFSSNTLLGGRLLSVLGNEEQKRNYLPKFAEAEIISATGVFVSGSRGVEDQSSIEWDPNTKSYLLNTEIEYMENADRADILLVPVRIPELGDHSSQRSGYFIVDPREHNVHCNPRERIGYKGINPCTVQFNNVSMPFQSFLEERDFNTGNSQHSVGWDLSLLATAFEALGQAKGVYNQTLEHAKNRIQFKRAIGKFPVIRRKISEMLKNIQASELLCLKTAWNYSQGLSVVQENPISAWFSLETAQEVAQEGLQIFGGYGYTLEYDIQRYYRDITTLLNSCTAFDLFSERIGRKQGLYSQ